MTTPTQQYVFNDDRLRAYLEYLSKTVLDPMTTHLTGHMMVVNLTSGFDGAFDLKFPLLPAELPHPAGPYLSRTQVDTRFYEEVRVTCFMWERDDSEGQLGLMYSADGGYNWAPLGGGGLPSGDPSIDFGTAGIDTGMLVSDWVELVEAAKADIMLRLYGYDPNQGPPGPRRIPAVGIINVQFRKRTAFEDPVNNYDERIQYLSDNQLPPFGPPPP